MLSFSASLSWLTCSSAPSGSSPPTLKPKPFSAALMVPSANVTAAPSCAPLSHVSYVACGA